MTTQIDTPGPPESRTVDFTNISCTALSLYLCIVDAKKILQQNQITPPIVEQQIDTDVKIFLQQNQITPPIVEQQTDTDAKL